MIGPISNAISISVITLLSSSLLSSLSSLSSKDSQPQDELLNHQMESDQPGYNMTEACEVRLRAE